MWYLQNWNKNFSNLKIFLKKIFVNFLSRSKIFAIPSLLTRAFTRLIQEARGFSVLVVSIFC